MHFLYFWFFLLYHLLDPLARSTGSVPPMDTPRLDPPGEACPTPTTYLRGSEETAVAPHQVQRRGTHWKFNVVVF